MCFSVQADLTVGIVLVPVAVAALREVRCRRELPFAALPALFALHQLVEAVVWLGLDGTVGASPAHAAALAYVLFALPALPVLLPLSVLLLEPRGYRARVLPFLVLGAVVAGYFLYAVLSAPVTVTELPHALSYGTGVQNGDVWAVLYVIAVIGPALLSGYRSIVAFGVLNLVALVVVAITIAEAFASVWCVYAAAASVLVVVHMRRRRRLPDPHRLHGTGGRLRAA